MYFQIETDSKSNKNLKQFNFLLPAFCCLFSGCCKDRPLPDDPPASVRRSVLVYLGTDNEFRAEAAEKIEQMKTSWNKDADGNLLVYADTGDETVLVHIYHSRRRGNVADTIETRPRENSAHPATFTRVLNKLKSYRPAASYGLVVLSHATGWLPAEMSYPAIRLKSVVQDKSANETYNYMELTDFADAIPYHLDFIVFDACFMGSVEVCYELKDKTGYLVASAAEVLAPGFVYSTMMQHLFAPVADLTAVARDFFEYCNSQTGYYRSATVSVVKTDGLEELASLVSNMTQTETFADDWNNIQTYGYGAQKIYFDLEDYLLKFSAANRDRIQKALSQNVTYMKHTPEYFSSATQTMQPIRTFCGLTVYIPQEAYPQANEACQKLKWTKDATSLTPLP